MRDGIAIGGVCLVRVCVERVEGEGCSVCGAVVGVSDWV